jgi:ABC-type lipopolysaccharide export system ATPase subunit
MEHNALAFRLILTRLNDTFHVGKDTPLELLKIEGLTKIIKKRKILDDLYLSVNSGEIVGFLGPNGAGKTTTIKTIMGLFTITAGKITDRKSVV